MYQYTATNYRMGQPVTRATFRAWSDEAAIREATRLLPTPNGLPGTGRTAGRASTVIGVAREDRR